MKAIVFPVLLVLLLPITADASDVVVGGVHIKIPPPPGFAPATPEMTALYPFLTGLIPPSSEELIGFIPEEAVPAALRGEIPEIDRRFSVSVSKKAIAGLFSDREFENLKSTIKTQNAELLKKAEATVPGLLDKIAKGVSEKLDVDVAFSVNEMIALPVHLEATNLLAYSMLTKYNLDVASDKPTTFVVAATLTFARVQGKILFLSVFAEETGIEWTRQASKQWAEAVLDSNPADPKTSGNASFLADVLASAIAAAAVAVGAVVAIIYRRRQRQSAAQ